MQTIKKEIKSYFVLVGILIVVGMLINWALKISERRECIYWSKHWNENNDYRRKWHWEEWRRDMCKQYGIPEPSGDRHYNLE